MKVLLGGASGMIGTALTAFLVRHDVPVVRLVRRPVKDLVTEIYWDPQKKEIDSSKLAGFDVVINLGGHGIASGLWTKKTKKKILESRVQSTSFLTELIQQMKVAPKLFLTASGIHIYGRTNDKQEPFTEDSPEKGKDFLSEVIKKWEGATSGVSKSGVRTCFMRFGAVLSPRGSMLKKMLPAFKFAAGGRLGSGKQALSWVDLDDAVKAIWHCLNDEAISGAVNVVAPEVVTNKEFTKALSKAVGMPAFLPVPEFILTGFVGEMAENLMLASIKCSPQKLINSGFEFSYPTLRESLNFQLKSNVPEAVVKKDASTEDENKESGENKGAGAK